MAFKRKAKTAKKKAKKSSKKGRDNEWDFDGGVTYENENQEDPKQYKRIHTQEKDERFRRGRLKVEDRKRKQQFIKKMSKKVKFSDIWQNSSEPQGKKDKEQIEEVVEKETPVQSHNPLPVLDRLQFFLKDSLSRTKNENDETGNDDDEMEVYNEDEDDDEEINMDDYEIEEESDEELVDNKHFLVFQEKFSTGKNILEDFEINEDEHDQVDSDSDDEEKNSKSKKKNSKKQEQKTSNENPYYNWFFDSKILSELEKEEEIPKLTSRSKLRLIENIDLPISFDNPKKMNWKENKSSLYRAPNKSLPNYSFSSSSSSSSSSSFENVQDIPGIHKLWKTSKVTLPLNPVCQSLMPKLLDYSDIFIEGRTNKNDDLLIEPLLMHGLFHVVKSRSVVMKHNQKLKLKEKEAKLKSLDLENILAQENEKLQNNNKTNKKNKKAADSAKRAQQQQEPFDSETLVDRIDLITKEQDEEDFLRDQGFVRPRLLILTPLRCTAKMIIDAMIKILGENTSISGLEKFNEEYTDPENDEEIEKQQNMTGTKKPDDWKDLFHGNIDDDFKIGIQVNPGHGKGSGTLKGVYLRLFTDFYLSDIIIASPIGLKLILENTNSSYKANKNNLDILTSIEQVIIHQCDVLMMQNFEHLNDIFTNYLNQFPKETHDITDFSRIRPYFLNGLSCYYRQLMITSSFNSPDLQSFFREHAKSRSGYYRLKRDWENGMISNVLVPNIKQIFQLIPGTLNTSMIDIESAEELKVSYFKENILNKILQLKQSRVLIIIPSYFDFVKIRNIMMKEEVNAVYISEYSRESEISRGRSRFYQGLKDIMVYSGRAHFFRRFHIRGANHVIFYSLPEYPHFYPELVNMLGDFRKEKKQNDQEHSSLQAMKSSAPREEIPNDEDYTSLVLCTPYEQMALERVLGKKRSDHMLESSKTTFLFF